MTEIQLAALCVLKEQKTELQAKLATILAAQDEITANSNNLHLYTVPTTFSDTEQLLAYYNKMITDQIAAVQVDIDAGLA